MVVLLFLYPNSCVPLFLFQVLLFRPRFRIFNVIRAELEAYETAYIEFPTPDRMGSLGNGKSYDTLRMYISADLYPAPRNIRFAFRTFVPL